MPLRHPTSHPEHILTNHNSEPGHRPPKSVKLRVRRSPHHVRPRHLVEHRVDPHRALLEDLPVPQLPPALRRVPEELDHQRVPAPVLPPHPRLDQATVAPQEHRAGLRREEAREGPRELELLLFFEEVEEGRRVDGGDVPTKRVESSEGGEVRARVTRGVGGGEWPRRLEERGVEGVPGDEWDGERLRGGLEQFVPELPELCTWPSVW